MSKQYDLSSSILRNTRNCINKSVRSYAIKSVMESSLFIDPYIEEASAPSVNTHLMRSVYGSVRRIIWVNLGESVRDFIFVYGK